MLKRQTSSPSILCILFYLKYINTRLETGIDYKLGECWGYFWFFCLLFWFGLACFFQQLSPLTNLSIILYLPLPVHRKSA